MPEGQVIGRLSIKVLPDTSTFRKELKAELLRVEKQAVIKVEAVLNSTGLKRSLLENLKTINAENRVLDNRKVRLYAKVTSAGVDASLREAVRDIETKVADKRIKLKTHFAVATADLELDKDSLKDVKKQLDKWRRDNDPIKIQVKPDFGTVAGRVAAAHLAILSRDRIVNLIPKVDASALAVAGSMLAALSGARVLSNYFDDMWNSIKKLDKAVPMIATLAEGIAGLSAYALSATANILGIAGSLASIVPAALALPGIIAGLGVGLGVTVIGFKNLKKALPDVYKQFQDMANVVTKDFWSGASDGIRQLADVYLPHLNDTAKQVGTFWGQLASELSKPFHTALGEMFGNLNESIKIATDNTNVFANIITLLGTQGSQYLPRLAQGFVNISTQFSDFLTRTSKSGELKQWIDTGIQALKDLGSVVGGVFSVFRNLMSIAAESGGSTLATLGQALHTIADVINSPAFRQTLVGVLTGAHAALDEIANVAGPAVTQFFQQLGQVLMQILPSVGEGIGTLLRDIAQALSNPLLSQALNGLFQDLATAIHSLTPLWLPLSNAIAALGPVVGALARAIAPVLASAMVPLANIFQKLSPIATELIQTLGSGLLSIVQQLGPVLVTATNAFADFLAPNVVSMIQGLVRSLVPVLVDLGETVGGVLAEAFKAIGPLLPRMGALFGKLLTAIEPLAATLLRALGPVLPIVAEAFGQILTALTPLIAPLSQLLTAIIVPLAPLLASLAATILPPLTAALVALLPSLVPIIDAFTQLVNLLMPVLIPAIQLLASILTDTVVMAINGVTNVINGALLIIEGVWEIISGIFTGDWARLWQGVKDLFKGVWDAIVGIIELALTVSILKGFGLFRDAFKAGWSALWNGVRDLGKMLWDSIQQDWQAFLSLFKEAPGAALSLVKDLFSSAWADIKAALAIAIDNLMSLWNGFLSFFTGIPAAIGGVAKGMWDGLLNGAKSIFNKIAQLWNDTLGKIDFTIPSWVPGIGGKHFGFPKIPLLATGGVFTDATLAVVGEASTPQNKEIVTPERLLRSILEDSAEAGAQKILNYYAAPGNSLDAEEDLFAAAGRARMVGW